MASSDVVSWGKPRVKFSTPIKAKLAGVPQGNSIGIGFEPTVRLKLESGIGSVSALQLVSFRVPVKISSGACLFGFITDITFGVMKSPGARILIVTDLAGTAQTIEYAYENATAPPTDVPMAVRRVFSVQGLEHASANGLGVAGGTLEYEATLLLGIQRTSSKEHGLIGLDAIDIVAIAH